MTFIVHQMNGEYTLVLPTGDIIGTLNDNREGWVFHPAPATRIEWDDVTLGPLTPKGTENDGIT